MPLVRRSSQSCHFWPDSVCPFHERSSWMLQGRGLWLAFHGEALHKMGGTWMTLGDRAKASGFNVVLPRGGGTTRDPGWDPWVARRATRILHDKGLLVVPWFY